MLQYTKVQSQDGFCTVTLLFEGQLYTATNDHPNWESIVAGLDVNDPNVVDLFDLSRLVTKKFQQLSERVSVRNGTVLFDGDERNNVLTKQILRFLDNDEDFTPLVNFYERLALNPAQESVEQLYNWLDTHDFTITAEGKIVGYKGVRKTNDGYVSINTGNATVNGEEHNGAIPNNPGDIVEMPRSAVQADPNQGCSYGLHVGTWDYAKGWAKGAVLKVVVDPRDVVSVPNDSSYAKLRTCRYTVVEVIDQPLSATVDRDYDDDEHDVCDYCDACLDCDRCYDNCYCDDCDDFGL